MIVDTLTETGSRLRLYVLLTLAVSFQLIQGIVKVPTLNSYNRSYYLVTYQMGFTRRGLAGELIRRATGSIATTAEINVLQSLITLALVVGVVLVVVAALRRRDVGLD